MLSHILVIGDSLSLPRHHKAQQIEDTWPFRLADLLSCYVWNVSRPGATSFDVLRLSQSLESYVRKFANFQVAVVQVGIVDATPRSLGPFAYWLYQNIPRGSRHVSAFFRVLRRLLFLKDKPLVSDVQYGKNIVEICELLQTMYDLVILVKIVPPSHHLLNVPGVEKSVEIFNNEIDGAAGSPRLTSTRVCNPWTQSASTLVLPDGHHLTNAGHQALALAIQRVISDHVGSKQARDLRSP